MLASEFFSAWYMGRNPSHEIIFASYAQDRSDDVGKAVRDLMLTETHENVFPEGKLRLDAKGTRKFQTINDGTFFSASWKSATTGRGANLLILDDLLKDREDAQSGINRRRREEWFSSSGYTRLMSDEGSSEGRILLIMTRWAYDDIAAYLLKQLAHENWHVLNCPAIAEEEDMLGRKPGDALWPEKYPVARLEKIKKSVNSEDWSALYQQRPLPKEGGLWKLHYFKEYNVHHLQRIEDLSRNGEELPEQLQWFYRIVLSLDTAYKTTQMNDPSVLTVWGYSKNRQYLIEVARERLVYPDLKKWIIKYHQKYLEWNMGPVPVLIEDAASGQSLIQDFKDKDSDHVIPVIAIKPINSKVIRAEHAAGYAESEAIALPESAPWLTDFKMEFAQFPYGPNDDQVDSTSQYIGWFYKPKKRKRGRRLYAK
jgi:predicted phage terminase large subunit-like protein